MEKKKFEIVYKWRFLPLAVTGTILVIVLLLKYVFQIEVGKFFGWSIFLTFAGFIYYRGVLEQKNNKEKEEESVRNPLPPPTKEQLQKQYEDKMQSEIGGQRDNIIIRSVYLFFCLLIVGFGLSIIFSNGGDWLFGLVVLVVGISFTVHSVFLLRKWIRYLKFFKEEKKKKVFDKETDSEIITANFDETDKKQ